jgi:hypothetical protein
MQKTIQHLDFVAHQYHETGHYLNQKELTSVQFFCIGLLERLANNSKALKVLLSEVHKNPALEFGCGIIMRSALLDSLIVLKLYSLILANEAGTKTQGEKDAVIKDYCDTILSDGLSNTLGYFKVAKDTHIITEEQYTDTLNEFAKKYEHFFQPHAGDGSVPNLKIIKYYSPTNLFKDIAANPTLKELSKQYDAYLYFSKYDHFGILYYEVSRQNHLEQIDRIQKAIEFFVGINSILHMTLRLNAGNDGFLNHQSNTAAKYLDSEIVKQEAKKSGTI